METTTRQSITPRVETRKLYTIPEMEYHRLIKGTGKLVVKIWEEKMTRYSSTMTERIQEIREGFSTKQIKMAIGIASDKRYAGGNYGLVQ